MDTVSQKIFFNINLKFLRERRRISQEQLAAQLGITRAKLAALEVGNTKAPQPEDYLRISDYFNMSIDTLLKVDLRKIGELKIRELEAGNDVYMRGGNLRILAISIDKSNKEQVDYVPIKAKAGYVTGYHDPEFIANLPKYSLPHLPRNGTFRIFPTVGDSMLPIPEGSDIIARYVEDWTTLTKETLAIVVLQTQQDVVFKMATIVPAEGIVYLRSLNPSYPTYTVRIEDIAEVWSFFAYTSQTLPMPSTDLEHVLQAINDLKQQLPHK